MTYIEFKREIAAYLNRSISEMTVAGVDLLANTINKSRRFAQRQLDFEDLRCAVDLTVSVSGGSELSGTVLSGTSTSATVNRIERAYVNIGGTLRPVDYTTRSSIAARMHRLVDQQIDWRTPSTGQGDLSLPSHPTVYRHGTKIYLWPADATVFGDSGSSIDITFDVVRFAEDYEEVDEITTTNNYFSGPVPNGECTFSSIGTFGGQQLYSTSQNIAFLQFDVPANVWKIGDTLFPETNYWQAATLGPVALFSTTWLPIGFSEAGSPFSITGTSSTGSVAEDFFLTECHEWMLFYCMRQLEFYNRNRTNDRFVITQAMIDAAWKTVVDWNNSISDSSSSRPVDLD